MAVLLVAGESGDECLVAGDFGLGEGSSHAVDAVIDGRFGKATLDEVAAQFVEDVGRPLGLIEVAFGEAEQGVAEVAAEQDVGIQEGCVCHPRSAGPGCWSGGGVVEACILSLLGHLVQCRCAIGAGMLLVVE